MTATEDRSQERREREEREERERQEREKARTGAPPGGSQVTRMVDRGDVPSGGGRPEEKIETIGGQVYRGGRLIGYSDEGAVSATEGGVVDPTVVPGGHTVTDPNPFEGKEQAPAPKTPRTPEKK